MISIEERVSLLELLFRETGLSLPELAENPEVLETLVLDVFDDLQRTKVRLLGEISALRARNKDLEGYVHMVAHNLKEPLAVLAITSSLITNIPGTRNGKLNQYMQQMGLTAQDMKRIIDNLSLFARVTRAEAPVAVMHMERVVAKVQDRLDHLICEKRARIVLPKMWPLAIGYEPWIEEVWTNYLSNGLKYGGHPPTLELGASTVQEGVVRFWIRDNGPGVPVAIRQRLFTGNNPIDAFKEPETGFGLSIVQHIIEKLRGQVGVESDPGAGSCFFFSLPAAV